MPDVQIKHAGKFCILVRAKETEKNFFFSFMLTDSRRSGLGTSQPPGVAKTTFSCTSSTAAAHLRDRWYQDTVLQDMQ